MSGRDGRRFDDPERSPSSAAARPDVGLAVGADRQTIARLDGCCNDTFPSLVRRAREYFRAGGGPEPPPLAAASMPIPAAPSFVSAVAGAGGTSPGDDAA